MFKGFVLSESLKDPTVLNKLEQLRVIVERHEELKRGPNIWHDFEVSVKDKDMPGLMKLLSRQLKPTWYAHFWDSKTLYVVLPGKAFKIPREKKWQSAEYLECKEYAIRQGVHEKYLEFWLEDKPKKHRRAGWSIK